METTRPAQLPSRLLITAMCLLGIFALPAALFFLLIGMSGDEGPSLYLVLGLGLPTLIAYPVALLVWARSRRASSTRRAWLLATLGLALITGPATVPAVILGGAFVEEWQETQPGGRGYR